MPTSIDGTSLILTGCDITITNAFDPKTGVTTMTITPVGGLSNLPALLAGLPGQSVVIDSITTPEYAAGATLPSPSATQVSPGGAGVAAHYTLTIPVHAGPTGLTGTPSIVNPQASDLVGTPIADYVIVVNPAANGAVYAPRKVGGLYGPTSIPSTAAGTTSPRTLTSLSIPSQPFDWWPDVVGQATVGSTAADTHVDLIARLNNATSGDQVGYGNGVTGANPPPVGCISAFGGPPGGTWGNSAGKVLAGQAATVHLIAVQTGPSSNSWSTSGATFRVRVSPVP